MIRSSGHAPCLAAVAAIALLRAAAACGEPVVLRGAAVAHLLGTPLRSIRIVDPDGRAVPFQIDEKDSTGAYLCPEGPRPSDTAANGLLDSLDEICFRREDAPLIRARTQHRRVSRGRIEIRRNDERRVVLITADTKTPLSPRRYIDYDHRENLLETPWFYARFGAGRFHFVRAGIQTEGRDDYIHIVNELRVQIYARLLWGLLAVTYDENSLRCDVTRYKVGPVRAIRTGDFYLKLGMLIKAGRAEVTMICYPKLVRVPVVMNVPLRLRTVARNAWVEMTPVVRSEASAWTFEVGGENIAITLDEYNRINLPVSVSPESRPWRFTNGRVGFGWLLQTTMPADAIAVGSGFVLTKPTLRDGVAHCGYRVTLRDLPRGRYDVTNWVTFANADTAEIGATFDAIRTPSRISVDGGPWFDNRLR